MSQTTASQPASTEPSDEALARQAQAGSRDAYMQLVARFEPRLLSFLRRRVGARADAEDLCQEAFLRAWRRIETYDPERRFSTWLFTVAARVASTHARSRKPMERLSDGGTAPESAPPPAPEDRRKIWVAAERVLTPDQFAATWLRYVEGLAVEDIATVLGKSAVGTRVLLLRARERLARHWPERASSIGPGRTLAATGAPRRERAAAAFVLRGAIGGAS